MLMLQALAGQRLAQQAFCRAGPARQAQHLQGVGGKAHRLAQAAAQQPRHPALHRRVLPRCQHAAVLGVVQRLVVEVLADISLVEPDRGPRRQRHVLQIHQVQPQRQRALVLQIHMPEPRRRAGRQHQLDPVGHATPPALVPDPARTRQARLLLAPRRGRAEQRCEADAAIGLMAAQPKIGRARLQRAGRKQVQRQPAAGQGLQATVGMQRGPHRACAGACACADAGRGQQTQQRGSDGGGHGGLGWRRGAWTGAIRWQCNRSQPAGISGLVLPARPKQASRLTGTCRALAEDLAERDPPAVAAQVGTGFTLNPAKIAGRSIG